jgi:hypothetical protein
MTTELSVKQMRFVTEIQTGITATQAAINAGYSERSAKTIAHTLLHENKLVIAEMERLRQHLAKQAEYTIEKASGDVDKYIGLALAANQHGAVAKLQEQKLKLHLLIRKQIDVTVAPAIDISGALREAKERALRPRCDSAPALDGDFVALPSVVAAGAVDNKSLPPIFYDNKPDMDL